MFTSHCSMGYCYSWELDSLIEYLDIVHKKRYIGGYADDEPSSSVVGFRVIFVLSI